MQNGRVMDRATSWAQFFFQLPRDLAAKELRELFCPLTSKEGRSLWLPRAVWLAPCDAGSCTRYHGQERYYARNDTRQPKLQPLRHQHLSSTQHKQTWSRILPYQQRQVTAARGES